MTKRRQVVVNLIGSRKDVKRFFATEIGIFFKKNKTSSTVRHFDDVEIPETTLDFETFYEDINKSFYLSTKNNFDIVINESSVEDIHIKLASFRNRLRGKTETKDQVDALVKKLRILENQKHLPSTTLYINIYLLWLPDSKHYFDATDNDPFLEFSLGEFLADRKTCAVKIIVRNRSKYFYGEEFKQDISDNLEATLKEIQRFITVEESFKKVAEHWIF